MRYKGFKEYVLITGYIDAGLLDCFVASAIYMHIFPLLGALWKFEEDDNNEVLYCSYLCLTAAGLISSTILVD